VRRGQIHWEDRPAVRPHRGGTLLTLAIAGLFCCGIILGPIVVIVATLDLAAMREGRMDAVGEGTTRTALVIGYVAGALHLMIICWRLISM
jgi:hypothetical protein